MVLPLLLVWGRDGRILCDSPPAVFPLSVLWLDPAGYWWSERAFFPQQSELVLSLL